MQATLPCQERSFWDQKCSSSHFISHFWHQLKDVQTWSSTLMPCTWQNRGCTLICTEGMDSTHSMDHVHEFNRFNVIITIVQKLTMIVVDVVDI